MGRMQDLRIVDPVLTNLARGYSNAAFAGTVLFPVVNVNKEAGKIPLFGKEAFTIYNTERALRAKSNKIPVETTLQLHAEIIKALKKVSDADRAEEIKKSSARTFQALRIDINHEYESLYTFLEKLPGVLTSGGKAAILTFHSGEDRLVKKSFRENFRTGIYREISEDVIRSSAEEIYRNSRARSAKFRWAIRA